MENEKVEHVKKGGSGKEKGRRERLMGVDVLHVIHMVCNIAACGQNT